MEKKEIPDSVLERWAVATAHWLGSGYFIAVHIIFVFAWFYFRLESLGLVAVISFEMLLFSVLFLTTAQKILERNYLAEKLAREKFEEALNKGKEDKAIDIMITALKKQKK
ncbi:MAG TPA: hypothetical protein VI894_03780 [Candidatus Nanoarchaeia archaeon]|nr:hypothetical protein [Candidatus Nanoarchaeia archaeon]